MTNLQLELAGSVFILLTTASQTTHGLEQFPDNLRESIQDRCGKLLDESPDILPYALSRLAETGRVTSVTLGSVQHLPEGGPKVNVHTYINANEAELLAQVGNALLRREEKGSYKLAGYDVRTFDIPFLTKRFWANGLPVPTCLRLLGRKPWDSGIIDVADLWSNHEWKQHVSLLLFCQAVYPSLVPSLDADFAVKTAEGWFAIEEALGQEGHDLVVDEFVQAARNQLHAVIRSADRLGELIG
jgi:hypothetical protein